MQISRKDRIDEFRSLLPTLQESYIKLKGSDKRRFLINLARNIGWGGKTFVIKYFKTCHETLNKAEKELETGILCIEAYALRHRPPIEKYLPNLLVHIREIVEGASQIDPKFRSTRLYTKLTAQEIRDQLIKRKGYSDEELPSRQIIWKKTKLLGYSFKKIQKTRPLKKNT